MDVKLGDFETFYRPPSRNWRSLRCTPRCIAPEIILDHPKDENGQDIEKDAYKNDVWGLALVLWEVQSWVMCKNNVSTKRQEILLFPSVVNGFCTTTRITPTLLNVRRKLDFHLSNSKEACPLLVLEAIELEHQIYCN